ncbi:hypothetical protein LXL04_001261 [Taraxacum kok-saghyz]
MENHEETTTPTPMTTKVSPAAKKALLVLSCILLAIGNCGGPLITRLYFIHGGNRVWLSSSLETAGWPFFLVVHLILYFHRLRAAGKDGNNKHANPAAKKNLLILHCIHYGIGIVVEDLNAFPEEDGLQKFREWIESSNPSILGKVGGKEGRVKKGGPKSEQLRTIATEIEFIDNIT